MGTRVLFAALVAISTVVISSPASAKPFVAEARIVGPGIDGGITIGRRHAGTLWKYGISRADSIPTLGLTPSDLEVRYVVTYGFRLRDDIRQGLYPYAEGGPVTYTPPHQELTGPFGDAGYMRVTPGRYRRSSPGFLAYLVGRGVPEREPVVPVSTGDAALDPAPGAEGPWTAILIVLGGVTALSPVIPAVRRRMVALAWQPRRRSPF